MPILQLQELPKKSVDKLWWLLVYRAWMGAGLRHDTASCNRVLCIRSRRIFQRPDSCWTCRRRSGGWCLCVLLLCISANRPVHFRAVYVHACSCSLPLYSFSTKTPPSVSSFILTVQKSPPPFPYIFHWHWRSEVKWEQIEQTHWERISVG